MGRRKRIEPSTRDLPLPMHVDSAYDPRWPRLPGAIPGILTVALGRQERTAMIRHEESLRIGEERSFMIGRSTNGTGASTE